MTEVLIEAVRPTPGRQIGPRAHQLVSLAEHREVLQHAIREGIQAAAVAFEQPAAGDWKVSSVEITFGVSLTTEAGVIISKVAGEASFEVSATISRT